MQERSAVLRVNKCKIAALLLGFGEILLLLECTVIAEFEGMAVTRQDSATNGGLELLDKVCVGDCDSKKELFALGVTRA